MLLQSISLPGYLWWCGLYYTTQTISYHKQFNACSHKGLSTFDELSRWLDLQLLFSEDPGKNLLAITAARIHVFVWLLTTLHFISQVIERLSI